jgi:PAS domain S-box-containing protein
MVCRDQVGWLRHLRLQWKLLGAMVLVAAVAATFAAAASYTARSAREATSRAARTLRIIGLEDDAQAALIAMQTGYRGFLLSGDEQLLQPYATSGPVYTVRVGDLQAELADDPQEVARWQELKERIAGWQQEVAEPTIQLRRDAIAGRATLDDVAARESAGETQRRLDSALTDMADAITLQQAQLAEQGQRADEASSVLQWLVLAGLLAIVGTGVLLAVVVGRDLKGPVNSLTQAARKLAAGDLSQRIRLARRDELGEATSEFDRMADELERLIRQNASILRAAGEGILGLDAAGRITFASAAASRLTGRSVADLVGREVCSIVHPSSGERSHAPGACPIKNSVAAGELHERVEDVFTCSNAPAITVEYTCAPIVEDEQVTGGVLTFRDIAERQRAELERLTRERAELARIQAEVARQASQRAEDTQRFLVHATDQLMASLEWEVRLHRLAQVAIPFLADTCLVYLLDETGRLRLLASARAETTPEAMIPELDRWWQAHAGEVPTELAAVLVSRTSGESGAPLLPWTAILARLAGPGQGRGQPFGLMVLARVSPGASYTVEDVALANELAPRAALALENAHLYQQAQQAIRVRDEFLAAASHDLRTPLSHIKGFVSTLRQTDVEWDEETRRDFLAEIEREADRLAQLIGDVLDLSRIESGGLEPMERAATSLGDVISGGLDRARRLLDGRELAVDVPSNLPAVWVEATQIERVVANLVENAVKYTPSETPIHLSASQVDGAVELRVDDEGPGIPPQEVDRIFEKFVRGSSTRASKAGTGLGLAICRGIVEAHGGRIWAENRPDGGARLVVRLPLALETAKRSG